MRKQGVFNKAWIAFIVLILTLSCAVIAADGAKGSLLLNAMQEELNRSMTELKKQGENAPYFISYRIVESRSTSISASYGALTSREEDEGVSRYLDVDVRVGNYKLDSAHPLRDGVGYKRSSYGAAITIDDDIDSIKSTLWQQTDKKYKEAVERLIKVRSDQAVKTAEENLSDDFSQESPETAIIAAKPITTNKAEWEQRLRRLSALLKAYPFVYHSSISITATTNTSYIVNSEGTKVQTTANFIRLVCSLSSKAKDGMGCQQFVSYFSRIPAELPAETVIAAKIRELADNLRQLRSAPLVEPYTGPAILSGQAAGVFFHEIFGHRVEGHRQKNEKEGQTFAKRVNEKILPDFISVYDDPTVQKSGKTDLFGYYHFDDEGVKAQRVTVVENGILKNFLMSRSPFKDFKKSNGHGRAQFSFDPVSRQGNIIVQCAKTMPYVKLRQTLIEECKKQNKPFGLVFQTVEGGFTTTGRTTPNAFNVSPILVYRVYVDGRPDEPVRGVDLIGTPLTPFSKILASSDTVDVFNGYCHAESGSVPVSAVSPALLVSEIEVQKKQKSSTKPPILPPPFHDKQPN